MSSTLNRDRPKIDACGVCRRPVARYVSGAASLGTTGCSHRQTAPSSGSITSAVVAKPYRTRTDVDADRSAQRVRDDEPEA